MEKEAEKEDLGDYSDLENRKEFRAEDFELSSYTSPNSPLRITIFEDSDEQIEKEKILKKVVKEKKVESENWVESDSKQDSRSQMLKNGKKKKTKKKFISIDLTESADEEVADSKKSKNKRDDNGTKRDPSDFGSSLSKMEKEHKSKKRKGRNSESFSESNGNYEIDNSPPAKSDKKRKKIKHEHSNLTEESVQEIKTLPQEEIRKNLKKRKISESTEGANHTSQKSGNVNSELKIEKESDSELIQEIYSDKFKVKKQKKKKRKRNLKEETGKENWPETIVNVETESGCSDPEHLKALRENGCRVSFFASPNSHLGITSFKDCDEHMAKEPVLKKIINEEKMESKTCEESNSKKDSISQIPENGKKNKKKKKLISIDLTESADEEFEDSKKSKNKREESGTEKDPSEYVPNLSKMEKEDKRKKRRERNSESLNASDEICEIDNSPPNESDKNRKKVKHEPSEATKQSVQGMKTLPENEICTNLKKRKISESTAGANDTSKKSGNVNTELKKEKESDSESIQEVPFDKVKVKEEKKKKREKNVKEETLKENFGDSETGIEIMGKRDLKQSRNEYLEMQISNVVNIDANKEESSKKRAVKEEKSAELSSTPGAIVNIETASPCSDPENAKSGRCLTGRGNVFINYNTSHNLSAEVDPSCRDWA
ncbi:cylicin-2-like [Belonocnema kinseyi]|uniref:cylicin-2-like n=1 Tax=Belonocnema kinseyi TaxID=2817044 RepID=UPI00143D5377|nr:cylicin-2-like [Belonocnema kinseyi]